MNAQSPPCFSASNIHSLKAENLSDKLTALLSQAGALATVFADENFLRWPSEVKANSLQVLRDLIEKTREINAKLKA